MARSRRSGRTGSVRSRRGEVAQEAAPYEAREPERMSRVSSRSRSSGGGGMFIGLVIPMVVTVLAAVFLLLTGFLTANAASKGMYDVLDKTGVGIAIALSDPSTDTWKTDYGTSSFYQQLMDEEQKYIDSKSHTGDSRDKTMAKRDFDGFIKKIGITEDPQQKARIDLIRGQNQNRMSRLVEKGSPILFAEVLEGNAPIATSGTRPNWQAVGQKRTIAGVTVENALIDGSPGRIYSKDAFDAIGAKKGEVKVFVTTRPAWDAAHAQTGTVLIYSLVGFILVGGAAFGLCLAASSGIKGVNRALEQVARGDLSARIPTRGSGEIGSLGRLVDRAVKTFRAVQEQSVSVAVAQPAAPVEASLDTSTILPSEPPRVDGFEIEAVHKPCPEGANDYYDYFEVDSTHVGIVVADMPHPGPAGAFTTATFRGLMRAYAAEETSPAAVLGRVNRVMANELKRGDHITAMYAIVDTDKGIVSVASAGHLPLVFWKFEKKGSALLNPEGIAIGLDKGPVFEKTVVDKRIKLDRGDRIVLYTDGPVAATNAVGEEFGEQRFYMLISREAPKNSAAFVNFVANEVDLFHEGAPQQDDITIVTVRKVKE